MKKVIGIVGHAASGKDTVAEFLERKGFEHFSSGNAIREAMKDKGLPMDRTSLHNFVKEMRKIYGNQYPYDEIVKLIKKNSVISGIRNSAGIDVFKKEFGKNFLLIAIDAPIEFRYKMARNRGRAGDEITFEKFKEEEEREKQTQGGTHELDKVIGLADVVIMNDGTKEDLFKNVENVLAVN